MSASVADELAFDALLDGLPDAQRRSVQRVLDAGGFRCFADEDSYQRGYLDGLEAEREKQKPKTTPTGGAA